MKRLIYLLLLAIFSLTILSSCSNNNYIVTIHYKDNIETIKVKNNQKIDFEYTYDDDIFLGWYDETYSTLLNDTLITKDIEIYPLTTERGIQYRITYELDGGTFDKAHPIKYISGESLELVNPVKDNNYEFLNWTIDDKIITEITDKMYGNITLKANWKDIANYYKIKLHIDNAKLSNELQETYRENSNITIPYPIKDNYYFKGWYLDSNLTIPYNSINETIKSDIELYAKYSLKTEENTYISFLGDSITTFDTYIPEGFATYYPQGDVTTVNDTWLYQVVNNLNYNLLVNDSYSGTLVTSGSNYGSSVERIKLLSKNGISPDIVIIHMGTNDFTHSANIDSFKQAYTNMINLIKEYYDDVIIYVCTLPYNTYNESFIDLRLKENTVIKEIAKNYNLNLLDLETVITKDNVKDMIYAGSHPNKQGMASIAKYITNVIKGLN